MAKAVEIELASQGKTIKSALKNLQEALELYFEDEPAPEEKIEPISRLKLEKLFFRVNYA